MMFDGINTNLDNLFLLSSAQTRSVCAENKTGEKGRGCMAVPGEKGLGVGWKVSPCLHILPGETAVTADLEGPGAIKSIWVGGEASPELILRVYWDGQKRAVGGMSPAGFFRLCVSIRLQPCGWSLPHAEFRARRGGSLPGNELLLADALSEALYDYVREYIW